MIHRAVRILILESDPDDFERLEGAFEKLPDRDYSFSWTRSPSEALRQLRGAYFDVCLSASKLPDRSGHEFGRDAQSLGCTVPIILLAEHPVEALDADASNEQTDWQPFEILDREILDSAQLEGAIRSASQQAGISHAQRVARDRYQSNVRGPDDGIWDWDLETGVLYYSHRWKQQLGYTSREIDDSVQEWFSRIHADDLAEHQDLLNSHLDGHTPFFRNEYRIRHKDGSYRWMLCRGTVTRDADGQPSRLSGTHQDISELKTSDKARDDREDRVKQAQKMEAIGRLAGGIAHDFNNLMMIMLGYTRLLLKKVPSDSEYRGDLEEIKKAGEQASLLTRQLLAFGRKEPDRPIELDVCEILRSMDSMIRVLIGEDVVLEILAPTTPLPIFADPGRIEQILLNLAANGRDAMPQGGELRVHARATELNREAALERGLLNGSFVELTVSDTGSGMDQETKEKLFEPFFTTKTEAEGNGLGLSTAHSIVERYRGSITVTSEPGNGACFEILLPLVRSSSKVEASVTIEPAPVDPPPAEAPTGHERILLVEDNDNVRGLVKRILDSFDYDVLEAENAERALELCSDAGDEIDLLLTDVIMPRIDGRELAEQIRKRLPTLKVLFMSGYPGNRLQDHGVLSDSTDFIPKPFEPEDLAQKVREVLER